MKKGFTLIELLVVITIVLVLVALFFQGYMTDESMAIKALENAGYSDIKIVDKDIFFVSFRGGSGSDVARFTAVATNPAHKKVTVHVFVGWPFKGATIRYLD